MFIDPRLRALRSDDTPQRDAQACVHQVMRAWSTGPEAAEVLRDVEQFASQRPLCECRALASLFAEGEQSARGLAQSFVAAGCAALSQAPLGHMPMRHYTDGVISTLMLARSGNVTLALTAIDGDGLRGQPVPLAVKFGSAETWEHVLGGSARAELVVGRPRPGDEAELRRDSTMLTSGSVVRYDGEHRALLIERVEGILVTLRLQRRREGVGPAREYELATGKLLHQSSGNSRDSRHELMLALLGRMGRADAAPAMARIALEQGGMALRWQALRECLALDTQAGFAALTAVASAPSDPLCAPAAALRAQLVESYPQLEALEPCPA